MDVTFTAMMKELNALTSNNHKVEKLQKISSLFQLDNTPPLLRDVVQSSNVIGALAEMMVANKVEWAKSNHDWVVTIVKSIYFHMEWKIPQDQTKQLVKIAAEYLSRSESDFVVRLLRSLASSAQSNLILLQYPEIYNTLKRICLADSKVDTDLGFVFMQSAVANSPEWATKVITDKEFLLKLLPHPSTNMWILFSNLSRIPDAKSLLPPEVVRVASLHDNNHCTIICATLCNEADAVGLKLSSTFVDTMAQHLEELLSLQSKVGTHYGIGLLSVTVPFVNLSVADANKEHLGKRLIPLMKNVLAIDGGKPLIKAIARNLDRGKQEAAKTLWNLAFLESNRLRISDNGGLDFLKKILTTTSDEVLKSNIEGILFMFARESHEPAPLSESMPKLKRGHIMISYNWANQPTIVRLAKSLKDKGYNVWLDIEKMKGSTLAAMADAIEGAEVVLVCMTQKYKDSPNCRLEGEYCVSQKIDYIPLLLQNEYKPDGWLGIALGTKLWYSFASEDDWDDKMATLVEVLGERGKGQAHAKQHADLQLPPRTKGIPSWNQEDLLAWMKSERIDQHFDLFVQHNLNGANLLTLKAQIAAPLILKEFLQISRLGDVLEIIAALQKL